MTPHPRKPRQQVVLACAFCVAAIAAPVSATAEARADARAPTAKPNIVFVLADDLGYGDVGFNGQQHIRTPNLDRMAREGIVFDQHYAGSTVCMPSRCSLMTGRHTGRSTVRGNPRWTASGTPVDLAPEDVTVAEELKRAGYRTGVFGKWGLAEADDAAMPLREGFDAFYGYRRHLAAHHYYPPVLWRDDASFDLPGNDIATKSGRYAHDLIVDEALKFVRASADEPFFLYFAPTIPHFELTVPEDSKAPYRDLDWPRRPMKMGHYKHDEEGNVAYAGMVSRLDRDLGRLRALLDELGVAENTLIVFSSDNGPEYERRDGFFNSNGDYRGGKRDLYEGGIRVPFVATWPGTIEAGRRSDHPSAFWDFLPTACELAGVEPSADDLDGVSMAPTLLGDDDRQQTHEYLYWEFREGAGPMQAVRFGDWKAVKFRRPPERIELYNLASDPSETNDVAADNAELIERSEQLLVEARTHHPEFSLTPGARRRKKE